ncbi:unnamed protein product [Lathyrus oleraceus]
MTRPVEDIKNINDYKDLWKIVVRIKDLWSITTMANKDHLKMVVIDSKRDMIQVIVPPHLVLKHKDTFKIGKTYIIQNFKVAKNDLTFKAKTHNFKLIFCGATSARASDFPDILLNNFRFTSFEDMLPGKFRL